MTKVRCPVFSHICCLATLCNVMRTDPYFSNISEAASFVAGQGGSVVSVAEDAVAEEIKLQQQPVPDSVDNEATTEQAKPTFRKPTDSGKTAKGPSRKTSGDIRPKEKHVDHRPSKISKKSLLSFDVE
jgi:hypothetical protein